MPINDINWDDPNEVAKARGDYIEEEALLTPEEEAAKKAEDEAAAAAAEDAKKAEDEAAAAAKAEADAAEESKKAAEADGKTEEEKAAEAAAAEAAKAEADAAEEAKKAAEAAGEEDAGKEPMIPKHRYDSQAKRTKDLEAEIERLKSQQTKEETQAKASERIEAIDTELDALDTKLIEAIADNKPEDAAKLRREMRNLERERIEMELRQDQSETTSTIREEIRLDMVIDDLEKKYVQFQKEAEGYDQSLVDEVLQLKADLEVSGRYTPSQALLKAVALLVPDPADASTEKKEEKAPETPAKTEAELAAERVAAAEKTAEERRQAALKKAVDDAGKQPPDTSGQGEDSDKNGLGELPNPYKLKDADFDALPPETLRRMRGDYVH